MNTAELAADPKLAALDPADLAAVARAVTPLTREAGAVVIQEGDTSRDMYFVLQGRLHAVRGGMTVAEVGPGGRVGEIALVTGHRRAAAVIAATDVVLARLDPEGLDALFAEAPRAAAAVLRDLVGVLGDELTAMTDSVGALLQRRSLPRRLSVKVTVGGASRSVPTGTPAEALLPSRTDDDDRVVAALIDHVPSSLDAPLASDARLDPLPLGHWEGGRVYRCTVALMLLEAARRLQPPVLLQPGPSVGYGRRVYVGPPAVADADLARRLKVEMHRIADANLPISVEWWTAEEARTYFAERGDRLTASMLRTNRHRAVPIANLGLTHAPANDPLLPATGRIDGFDLLVDDGTLLLTFGEAERGRTLPARGPHAVTELLSAAMNEHALWLERMGIDGVGAFNDACIDGNVRNIIQVAEGFHEKRIGRIADAVAARGGRVRVIGVAGPSSSGKTTFIKRLTIQLRVAGFRPVGLSLDDYYVDRERTPRDEHGDYDFEALHAIDLERLNDHLARLLAGETVRTARYDFTTGKSYADGGPVIRLEPDMVLLLEGIHGLNPELTPGIADESAFRVFVNPITTLPIDRLTWMNASDVRLLRRIIRDRRTRAIDPAENIRRWPSVRAGERKWIFPHIARADAVFDTALVYEPSVLKVYAERYLLEVPQTRPEFATAYRLRRLIDRFVAIYPDHVPPTSLLREFIGGSGFEY